MAADKSFIKALVICAVPTFAVVIAASFIKAVSISCSVTEAAAEADDSLPATSTAVTL